MKGIAYETNAARRVYISFLQHCAAGGLAGFCWSSMLFLLLSYSCLPHALGCDVLQRGPRPGREGSRLGTRSLHGSRPSRWSRSQTPAVGPPQLCLDRSRSLGLAAMPPAALHDRCWMREASLLRGGCPANEGEERSLVMAGAPARVSALALVLRSSRWSARHEPVRMACLELECAR